jgi:hypothetical protein
LLLVVDPKAGPDDIPFAPIERSGVEFIGEYQPIEFGIMTRWRRDILLARCAGNGALFVLLRSVRGGRFLLQRNRTLVRRRLTHRLYSQGRNQRVSDVQLVLHTISFALN